MLGWGNCQPVVMGKLPALSGLRFPHLQEDVIGFEFGKIRATLKIPGMPACLRSIRNKPSVAHPTINSA